MFNRHQYIAIFSAIIIVMIMYFGCDRIPIHHEKNKDEKTANASIDATLENLLKTTKNKIAPDKLGDIERIEQQIATVTTDTAKSSLLKELSNRWYIQEQPVIAGFYANQVANIDNTEQGWNIAGSILYQGINATTDAAIRNYCTDNAVKAFDKAIGFDDKNLMYQINKALCYTENPPQDNAMKGILMLRELDTKYPENVQILFQLAKLAMKTNQYERAIQRLEQILKKTPNSPDAICMLSDAYRGAGDTAKAEALAKKCTTFFEKQK
jgi:tetratricopeptide (TPR) repeat protein